MKRIIYIRTSKEEGNPENQLPAILTLIPESERESCIVMTDQQSAFKDSLKARPEFSMLTYYIKHKQVSELYCWDLDRVYRNRIQLKQFLEVCKIYKVKVFSYRQSWLNDINRIPDPWNEIIYDFLINIVGWMAEDESKKKSDRVKAAIRIRKDGKTYSHKGNKWGRASLPTKTINRIIAKHLEGLSTRQIAELVKTYDHNNNPNRISKSTVHKIVQEYLRNNLVKTDSPTIDRLSDTEVIDNGNTEVLREE